MVEERLSESRPIKTSTLLMQIMEDVKALNSAVSLISQKMRHIARNEKILGRNIIVLNKKIKEIAESGANQAIPESLIKRIEDIEKNLDDTNKKIEEINVVVAHLRKEFVSHGEFNELKQIVDAINPLELVTIDQVKEIVGQSQKKSQSVGF
ncbi:MAG: hypothetical protein N3F05_04490 [Candidatus Diapherotrites archaeon]|nr:hypothetical protein [Candidatus Diapherotrites archaeon]